MARVLTNQTERLVMVRLRSGVVVHLAGGESSDEIEDIEVLDNPRVDVLARRGVVDVAEPSGSSDSSGSSSSGGKRSGGGGRKRSRSTDTASSDTAGNDASGSE